MAATTEIATTNESGSRNFDAIAKIFHWLMAVIILAAWIIGYYGEKVLLEDVSEAETVLKHEMIAVHKSIATLTLFLIVGRILWRAWHRPPALTDMPAIMKLATHFGHFLLYFLMVAVPVSGWWNSSAAGYKIPVLGLFNIPQLGGKSPELSPFLVGAHLYLSWALLIVVAGHAAFALKHHFIDKDETLTAMLPKKN